MIKKQTIEYKLVSIIGLAGEIQTEEIYKLNYGKEYIRKTISKLITKKCIKVYKFDNKKYLRLTVACKKYLLENYPERFESIFVGAARANKIRNEEHRRTRYHRLGELLILLDLADIKIFADEKTLWKKTHGFQEADGTDFTDYSSDKKTAEFYTATELKSFDFFGNARTSRAMGIIYSHPDVFVIYYFVNEFPKLEYKTESSFFYRAGSGIHSNLRQDYHAQAKIIFIGDSMKIFNGILRDKRKSTEKILKMSYYDDPVMFLDKSHLGSRQLMYFISERARNEMKKFSFDYFGANTSGWHIGLIPNTDTVVYDCTICNPIDVYYVKYTGMGKSDTAKSVNVMCFDFQYECIRKYVGDSDNVRYYTYDSEKVLETEDTR
ncbi:MAG: hypothetical protein IKW64_01595 [Clostridia bacterium]|nr:hypothetical protein [Clostridia bacterium]